MAPHLSSSVPQLQKTLYHTFAAVGQIEMTISMLLILSPNHSTVQIKVYIGFFSNRGAYTF